MSFARSILSWVTGVPDRRYCAGSFLLSFLVLCSLSCADRVKAPTPGQLAAFERAGATPPTADVDRIRQARLHTGPYRVVPGDVLEFKRPSLLQSVTAAELHAAKPESMDPQPYLCRIGTRGTITLPAVGEMQVTGKSLAEIEDQVIEAYRRYVVLRPSVFVRVLEYKTQQVAILGAVTKPGVYTLRGDQMSLVALLMEAGGIVKEGAAVVRIARPDPVNRPSPPEPAALRPPTAPRVRAVFQPEGPLHTTGWLTLERNGQTFVRRWLDLGNELQRQAFLGAVAATSEPVRVVDLQTQLATLALHLQSHPADPQAGIPEQSLGWQTLHSSPSIAYAREITTDAGADAAGQTAPAAAEGAEALVLPVRGWNIPFRDVALAEGDTVVVEQMQMPVFSVLGLVKRSGNFPYPPTAQYTLTQAIAFAEGLDPVANPRYATIYRLAQDGSIARVALRLIQDGEFTEALATPIRPGDVVAIEHTPRTRANMVINTLVRVNTGVYLTGNDLWGSRQ